MSLWGHPQRVPGLQSSAWVVPRGREGGCGYSTHQPALESQRRTFLGAGEIQGGRQESAEGPVSQLAFPGQRATAGSGASWCSIRLSCAPAHIFLVRYQDEPNGSRLVKPAAVVEGKWFLPSRRGGSGCCGFSPDAGGERGAGALPFLGSVCRQRGHIFTGS